jgi:hypothetical protein
LRPNTRGQIDEPYPRGGHVADQRVAAAQANAREHFMAAAGEHLQHADGVRRIHRFAEDLMIHDYCGIRSQHDIVRRRGNGPRFRFRQPAYIINRVLAG